MTIKKDANGRWKVDVWPNGANGANGKRYRKTLNTKAEALRWKAWIIKNKQDLKDWEPKETTDKRKLSNLIDSWWNTHGQNLKDGHNRKLMISNVCKALGDPIASRLKPADFIEYRQKRLAAGVSANTLNHEHTYLNAIFNELIRIDEWTTENPTQKIKKLKIDEKELSYLTTEQIKELLSELKKANSDAWIISRICLMTGARWSEIEELDASQIKQENGKAWISLAGTKNGKTRNIPIDGTIMQHINRKQGRLFKASYKTLQRRIKNVSFELPKGQLSHVFRHTFASHFMMNGGNIITLQRILGHGNLNMTMRYSHLAPEHLEEAIKLNPL
jgi:integrase